MAYQRVAHSDPFSDGSATDAAAVVNALSAGLEAAESASAGNITKSGWWTSNGQVFCSSYQMIANLLYLGLFHVRQAHSIDRIGVAIATPGSAGSVIRLGVYRLDANRADATLVLDAGTVDGTQAAGAYAITVDQSLTPGVYLLGAVSQGAPATAPYARGGIGAGPGELLGGSAQSGVVNQGTAGLYLSGVSGALPATANSLGRYSTAMTIAVRIK